MAHHLDRSGGSLDGATPDAHEGDLAWDSVDMTRDASVEGSTPDTTHDAGATADVLPPEYTWDRTFGDTFNDYITDVSVDNSGNIYVTGLFEGTVDLGGGNLTSTSGDQDVFVLSISTDGAHRWQTVLKGISMDSHIAVDSSGNVYVTGRFPGTVDLGAGDVTSNGLDDIYITSFSSMGVHRWQKALGGIGYDAGNAVAVDSDGNIYVTGTFEGVANLGGSNATSHGGSDAFVTSFLVSSATLNR